MKRIVAVAMTLIGLTAVAVVPGEWNSEFGTSLAYAEKYHLPIVVVWGNTSCHYCDELEAVFQDEGLTSWTSKHSILMVSKSEAIDSQDADNLAAKEWIKSLANVSSYPFVGVYWKKADGTVACSTAFVGREGAMPAKTPSGDLAGQLANSLDQLVGDYYPIADADYHTNTVDGVEWVFAVKDGEAVIKNSESWKSAIPTSTKGTLEIPAILGGCPVTEIGDHALYICNGLTEVTIPAGVTNIGEYAFASCSTLENVTIPEGVVNIADSAFRWCTALTNVTISSSVVRIGEESFSYSGLQHLTIPDGVTTIGRSAFSGCSSLRSVELSTSVTNIGSFAFSYCTSLTAFIVDEDNPNYKSVNGLLLTKDGQTLVCGVNGNVEIPYGVTNIGGMSFWGLAGLTSVTIPSSVSVISDYAFSYCSGLTSITIPASVECVGTRNYVFEGCAALNEVAFEGVPPSGLSNSKIKVDAAIRYNEAYADEWLSVIEACGFTNASPYTPAAATPDGGPYTNVVNSIQWVFTVDGGEASVGSGVYGETAIPQEMAGEIVIPSTLGGCPVTGIGESAFLECEGLTHVTIPAGVKCINNYAFLNCSSLASVAIPESVTNVGFEAFGNCSGLISVTIPDSVTSIDDMAFHDCNGLVSIALSGCLTRIGHGTFSGCVALTAVTIPEDVTSIGAFAFYDCCGLTAVSIPEGVTSVGEHAFYNCSGLTEVSIPSSVTSIGEAAFSGCNATIVIDDSCAFCSSAYCVVDEMLFDSDMTCIICCPTGKDGEVDLPDEVTSIGSWAFSGCSELTAVTIPDGVTSIGHGAFFGCSGLTSVTIPSGVADIFSSTFGGCSGLQTITVPGSVSYVGEEAFLNCDSLMAVDFEGAPPSGLADAFVPDGALIRYNVEYADEWLPVIEACGFTNASPYTLAAATPDGGPYTNVINSIQWVFTVDGGEASVGSGVYGETAIPQEMAGEIVIPSTLGGCPVTGISDFAFRYCTGLTHVTIPEGVLSIGNEAFAECENLESVVFPESLEAIDGYAFYGCRSLADAEFPATLGTIGYCAFSQCAALQSICLPQNIEYISVGAFAGCNASVEVDESCAFCASTYCVVDDMLFDADMTRLVYCPTGKSGDVYVPQGVEEFDFSSCSNLTSITLPKTVSFIPYWSLGGCSSLMEINIPKGVWGISSYAFCDCSALSTITLPESVTDVGVSAFWGCSGLKTLTIPWSVTFIGEGAFMGCDNLYAVDFECAPPSGVVNAAIPQDAIVRYNQEYEDEWLPMIEECGFMNASPYLPSKPDGGPYEEEVDGIVWTYVVYEGEATIESADPAADALVVPETLGGRTVTGLSDYAFYACSDLISIKLHRHIANVGCETFHHCSALMRIEVDAKNPSFKSENGLLLDKSGQSVVAGVNGVVTIPDGVTRIEENVFLGCGNLTSVVMPSSVQYVANGAFGGCEMLTNVLFEGSMPRCGLFAFTDRDNPGQDSQNLTIHTTADPLSCAYVAGVPVVFDNYKSRTAVQTIVLTVTNVVVHYITNSKPSDSVIPDTTAGIVNIIAEVDSSKAVAITPDWAAQYPDFGSVFGSDFSAALTMPTGKKDGAGNALLVWQDFVAGTDPTKQDDVFTASITFDKETGKPVISWSPELSAAEAAKREYKKYGKVKLTDEWVEISDAAAENYNFFKVSVGMK